MASGDDYNLREVTRALGIQNPDWEVRETIQPTLDVGSLAGLTPVHAPPTAVASYFQTSVVGDFSQCSFHAHGQGGTILARVRWAATSAASTLQYQLFDVDPIQIRTPEQIIGPFSNVPTRSLAFRGSDVDRIIPADTGGYISDHGDEMPDGLWLPPGRIIAFETAGVNTLIRLSIAFVDVPVVEGGR